MGGLINEGELISGWAYKRRVLYPGGLINGSLISGWDFIQNNIFVGNWMGLYPGDFLKYHRAVGGGALEWDFTV